jgi:SAM-dependent methyltransferase
VTHGTQTAGVNRLWLKRLFRRKECLRYQAVDEQWFREAVEDVPRWTFVDMGCGKGRALILAHEVGFRNLIGVDFSASLCRAARRNLARLNIPARIVTQDATQFDFPAEPAVLFFYNPFGEELMKRVLARIGDVPRILVYVNPLHRAAFSDFRVVRSGEHFSVYTNH